MTSPNSLEITGNLMLHPLPELLVEIMQARLDGSLRLSHQNNKTIVYVKAGEVVFAVSNQRRHRIFEMLLEAAAVTKQQLVQIPEFTNDLALAKALEEKEIFPASLIKTIFAQQIEAILRDAIGWPVGVWTFSPLARIKDDINFRIDTPSLLVDYGRSLQKEVIIRRFKSFREAFGRKPTPPAQINLQPQEAFLLSRFDASFVTIEEMKALSGLSDLETLQKIYILWLAGFLFRRNWDAAFDEKRLTALVSAKFELKKQAPPVVKAPEPAPVAPETKPEETPAEENPEEMTLEKYLKQVEDAETHYQLLDVPHKATTAEIKQAYFGLAKRFHPDLFHKQVDAKMQSRIQNAFSEIAHAYETLRDKDTRETYDFKLRKILQELEKLEKMGIKPEPSAMETQKSLTEASEIFDHGFNLLMEEDFEQALPFLARAVHLAPDVGRYHAYYGKVLSVDKNQRFKAEAELQTAIKLEGDNPNHRIMLAEFFLQYNLVKRAEGELNRLLAIFPDNKEAKALLDSLPNK